MNPIFHTKKKCDSCPYRLRQIKCVKDPCFECLASKRKKHPFQNCGSAYDGKLAVLYLDTLDAFYSN